MKTIRAAIGSGASHSIRRYRASGCLLPMLFFQLAERAKQAKEKERLTPTSAGRDDTGTDPRTVAARHERRRRPRGAGCLRKRTATP